MAETTVDTLPPSEPQPSKGAFERIIGVFFEPTATFADIARSPSFIVPLLLMMVCSCATAVTMMQRIDAEQMVRQQIMKSSRAAEIPKEQLEKQVEMGSKFAKYSFFAVPVILPIMLLIFTGVFFIMSNFVFGGSATFKQLFAVVTHAQLPGILLGILTIVVLFLKDPADIDIQNMVATNLGPLISEETSKIGHRLAISMDLFSFWQIFLLGKGISAAGRLTFGKALMAVLIPWALYVLVAAGLASLR
jgi:hypothetical protein